MAQTPNEWGPPLWYKLHMKTLRYPKVANYKEKVLAIKYFKEIEKLLPCEKCKIHYRQNLESNPVEYHVDTRDELVRWLINLHNKVNAQTGKRILSYEEAIRLYVPPPPPEPSKLPIIAIILLIIIIIVCLLNKS